ncbi:hypothetical protein BDN71DRAFT_274802 [Pleurotus eryngii]|uniref:DNA-directed RNA polymerase III subunit RPC9 n=1 Tax=Pleurotus eryngii TaxID=5323 RepID=A0A9P6A3T3_PLEER|nr:hypothetical protein BDN71DRAFT_274802 [Pleurotus eryngii]
MWIPLARFDTVGVCVQALDLSLPVSPKCFLIFDGDLWRSALCCLKHHTNQQKAFNSFPQVVKNRAALLSNFEVLTLLRELENDHLTRAKTALKVKKEEVASNLNAGAGKDVLDVEVSENLRTMEVEAIQYFGSDIQPAPYQTPEGIRQLLRSLVPYNLTKAEKLQIVNIAPQSMPVLWAIIEEMEDRMTINQMQEIIGLVQNSLTKEIKEPNQPNSHSIVSIIGDDQDAYGDDDGYMDVVDDAQFDNAGEGAGVEGDLDVDDD